MKALCPKCKSTKQNISKNGSFYRKSDSKRIQRFVCKSCLLNFSLATFSDCVFQKKRRINTPIRDLLCSSVSMRRIALIKNISRTTVKRKLEFLAQKARREQNQWLEKKRFSIIEFDDLESFEITKCKPLTVSMAVEHKTRKIIAFTVSPIGAKGLLTKKAFKKYGYRKNESYKNRELLFKDLTQVIHPQALFKTDGHTQYPSLIKNFFPQAQQEVFEGRPSRSVGQGELKKGGFDPLFSINHTFAMLRANMSRLVRKSWCHSKKLYYLKLHLDVYVHFHNSVLT